MDIYQVQQATDWAPDDTVKALIVKSKDLINKRFLSSYPKAEIIVSATSGFDHFNFKELKNSKVKFCYSPNANVNSATEVTLFHILNFFKKGRILLKQNLTKRSHEVLGEDLGSKVVGIIGLGRIGSKVSKTLNCFGCKVLAFDPYLKKEAFIKAGAQPTDLTYLLKNANVISLHCPLTKATRNIINLSTLSKINPKALLVNCARGGLVSTTALFEALNKNKIQGACLDVFENKPLPGDSSLFALENVIVTPHIGGYTVEAQEKSALEAAQQVRNWFEVNTPVLSLVPPDVAWKKDLLD